MNNVTSTNCTEYFKAIFVDHGIPECLWTMSNTLCQMNSIISLWNGNLHISHLAQATTK